MELYPEPNRMSQPSLAARKHLREQKYNGEGCYPVASNSQQRQSSFCNGRIPFAFLEDIHQRFVRTYGRAVHSAQAYAMNDDFSRVLSQQMEYYSNDPNADRINRLKGEMGQVRNVMIENIDKVLDRGDRLELLVDKTANMQGNTFRFRKQARRFRSTVWWRNVKLTVALIIILLVIVYVILAFACHGLALPSCVK
ncbi:Vesicle-associated membrane protein 713 [Vitis vinifera]|uniref:Vesicle-associated membrane protein 713 n=1 Tax=Vitis vinifera TaxID=29760 RepID=A0A438FZ60_VITVI|nr:Vesicle-associated membrane protein 713 [Vitis vinifera]